VFAPISAIFGLLFLASTLSNGIRLVELPAQENVVEIVAGYTSGELKDFLSTAAANTLLFDAYAAGGNIAIIHERDRIALRITAPKWSLPVLFDRLPALFREFPPPGKGDKGADPSSPDFVARIEEEIRNALLGPARPAVDYATGDAFILISEPAPGTLRDALGAIPKRGVVIPPDETVSRFPGERTLRFKSDLPVGGVIFASPIPSVYYKQWYSVLLLDRLIRRVVPLAPKTTLPLTARPNYYRLEVEVPSGQFPEAVEEKLLQELQRLQSSPASAQDLDGARLEAQAYLDSKVIREWFASHDILNRREEGMQWIQSMSADDMRVAARDLLIANRVIASYAPRPRLTVVTSEPLSAVSSPTPSPSGRGMSRERQGEGRHTPFPDHDHAPVPMSLAERLSSGVSLAASAGNAVFISNGPMVRFDRELSSADLTAFQQYGANRILVLAPPASMDRARGLWSAFNGAGAENPVARGKVTGGDLAALFILKTMIDLKLVQAGWWSEASIRLDAGEGSDLQIRGTDEQRAQILDWIKSVAAAPPADSDFAWVREVAIHRFALISPDLQALMWERDPQGALQGLETISSKHIQDVGRIYF